MIELSHKICCLNMLNAIEDGWIDEVVSGFFFPNKDETSCKSGIPRIIFCPFCGRKFKIIQLDSGWDWGVE